LKFLQAGSEDELMAAFELFDKDHKGVVSVGEMRHVLTTLGLKLSEDEGEEFVRDAGTLDSRTNPRLRDALL
jgi:calmodulin